jgi:general secretion pathway protein M
MKDWYLDLQPRERVMVALAAAIMVLAILYLGIWQPVNNGTKRLTASIETQQRVLTLLQQAKDRVTQPGAVGQNSTIDRTQSLVVLVDTTLRSHSLYQSLQRSQPAGVNGIRVEFQNVAFDQLIGWLAELSNNYDLQVQSGSFSTSNGSAPGRVNSTLTLERSL